jgi:hypothetical protein
MHCDCCDRLLSDSEATARFESGAYVSMCRKCSDFLPKEVRIITRADLEERERDDLAARATDLIEEGEEDDNDDEE